MSLKLITTVEQLSECREKWNSVSGQNPLQSWEWCANWLFHFEQNAKPLVLVETDDGGRWKSIAPMALYKTKFGENKLAFIGSGPTCTDYANLITSPENFSSFTNQFADWLADVSADRELGRVEVVEFDGMDASHETTMRLKTLFNQRGYRLHSLRLENCWKLDLAISWDEQNQQFSKKHRRKTKKAICRLGDASTQITFATNGNFDEFWNDFVGLHQKRRQTLNQKGCFANQRFESFLRVAAQGLLDRGLGEMIQIQVGQTAIASTLLFHNGSNVFMYQTGFDPEYQHLEPGYLLIVSSLQWAIVRGMKSFDFLRGDEEYKSRWNTTPVPMTKLRFVDTTRLGSRLRDLLWLSKVNARTTASRMIRPLSTVREILAASGQSKPKMGVGVCHGNRWFNRG